MSKEYFKPSKNIEWTYREGGSIILVHDIKEDKYIKFKLSVPFDWSTSQASVETTKEDYHASD